MAIFTYSQNLDYAYINGEGDIIKKKLKCNQEN